MACDPLTSGERGMEEASHSWERDRGTSEAERQGSRCQLAWDHSCPCWVLSWGLLGSFLQVPGTCTVRAQHPQGRPGPSCTSCTSACLSASLFLLPRATP